MDYSTLVAEEAENRLSRVPLTALYEALKQVKDGRKKRGCRYSLALILTLLLLARLLIDPSALLLSSQLPARCSPLA